MKLRPLSDFLRHSRFRHRDTRCGTGRWLLPHGDIGWTLTTDTGASRTPGRRRGPRSKIYDRGSKGWPAKAIHAEIARVPDENKGEVPGLKTVQRLLKRMEPQSGSDI